MNEEHTVLILSTAVFNTSLWQNHNKLLRSTFECQNRHRRNRCQVLIFSIISAFKITFFTFLSNINLSPDEIWWKYWMKTFERNSSFFRWTRFEELNYQTVKKSSEENSWLAFTVWAESFIREHSLKQTAAFGIFGKLT